MSKKVLYVTGTPLPTGVSRSKEVAEVFINAYKKANPSDIIIEKDLFASWIPYIDGELLSGWKKQENGEVPTEAEASKLAAYAASTEEFLTADKIIIQSSMWNLSIATQLKGYLDTLVVAGKTFSYTENGPKGLMKGKKAIHFHGAGGVYSDTVGVEHSDSFVTGILKFIGIEVLPTIWVEGIDSNPDRKDEIMQAAFEKAKKAAMIF